MTNPNATQIAGDHYKRMAIQPWDIVDTWPLAERVAVYRFNALKYLMRAGSKGPAQADYAKAMHYLEKLVAVLGGQG